MHRASRLISNSLIHFTENDMIMMISVSSAISLFLAYYSPNLHGGLDIQTGEGI